MTAWRGNRGLPPYRGRDRLAYAYDAQQSTEWGCFLEGSLAKEWLPVQAHHLRSLHLQRTSSVWARGLICQLWRAAFRMWRHCNGCQHSKDNPQNRLLRQALDSQIRDAIEQGSALVLPKHRHLFTKTLENRLTGVILEKQNWLDFVDMAQPKANAHRQCHQELKKRF
jgi:hypothetical protein